MTAPATLDDDLLVRARDMVQTHRGIPSQNQLKVGLGVGAPRARAVREQLVAEQQQRSKDRRKQMKAVARRRPQARRHGVFPAGLAMGLPAPVFEPGPALRYDYAEPVGPQPEPQVTAVAQVPDDAPGPVAELTPQPAAKGGSEVSLRRVVTWPALVVAAPAFVAIWAGWVGIGKLTGFGRVNVLPGFGRGWVVDTAITLPVGVEAYAAYAFYVALNPAAPVRARRFAAVSAGIAVLLGMGGQTAYHLMGAADMSAAPWQITTFVSCLPVAVFGLAAALVHMVRAGDATDEGR
jgi:hypothetical protein